MRNRLAIGLWCIGLMVSPLARGHEDSILPLGSDGTLGGLPPKFSPAKLRIDFSDAQPRRVEAFVLTLSGGRIELPRCLLRTMTPRPRTDIRVLASWYHDPMPTLPYYVAVELKAPASSDARIPPASEMLLFNLETGRLLRFFRRIPIKDGYRDEPVDVHRLCAPAELKGRLDPAYQLDW